MLRPRESEFFLLNSMRSSPVFWRLCLSLPLDSVWFFSWTPLFWAAPLRVDSLRVGNLWKTAQVLAGDWIPCVKRLFHVDCGCFHLGFHLFVLGKASGERCLVSGEAIAPNSAMSHMVCGSPLTWPPGGIGPTQLGAGIHRSLTPKLTHMAYLI